MFKVSRSTRCRSGVFNVNSEYIRHVFLIFFCWSPNKVVQTNYTLHLFCIFSFSCSDYVADLIKKLELCLTVVSILLKIRFGHAQISVPKIGTLMSKTACINPCGHYESSFWRRCVQQQPLNVGMMM